MSGFPTGLVFAIAVATILLCLVGWFLWHYMFSAKTDFSSHGRFPENPPKDVNESGTETAIGRGANLNPKTVASGDTISNKSDDDVVDLQNRPISNQQTVENTGDVSVSMDDEAE